MVETIAPERQYWFARAYPYLCIFAMGLMQANKTWWLRQIAFDMCDLWIQMNKFFLNR
jgi:hypothetical protein